MEKLIIENIPKAVLQDLIELYPNEKQRNNMIGKVILSALTEIIEEQKRKQFLEILDDIEPWESKSGEPTVVETLRKIREES